MSKKVFTSMKDENPELQKQIGCISGFFQLFDRHRFLTGQQGSSHNQNIQTKGGTRNQVKEVNNKTQKSTGKNVKIAGENQQFSTESSGTSMSSSSRSSSMSSLEFNRAIQIEPPSIISPMKIPENSNPEIEVKQHGNQDPQSLDFYDIVKDSMHRDVQGLSVKIVAKEEKKGRILKHVDSPRPLEPPKPVNMVAWDSPRLSYDGRDTQDSLKSATKPKELPRLSLDSREGSIKSFNEGTKCRGLLKGLQKGYGSSGTMLKQLQEPETSRRSSSVVARLMGLETFPDCTEACDTQPRICTSKNESNAEPCTNHEQHQSAASMKRSTFLQFRRDASILNVTPYSRFSLESEASQGSQIQTPKRSESSAKASNQSLSVYGEIEKRIADIEFKNSGKDLRALKQILDAMQRYKESFEITRDQASNSLSDNRSNSSLSENSVVKSPRIRQKDPASTTSEMRNSTQGSKSPIFTMKPAKSARETGKFGSANPANGIVGEKIDRKTAKGISPAIRQAKDSIGQPFHSVDKSNNKIRTSKLLQSPKVPQVINGENATNSSNTTGAKSPRLQKKFGLERRSPTTIPSSESCSNRRQHNRQSVELSSPSTTPRQRFNETKNQREDFKQEVGVEVIHIDQSNATKDLSKESFQVEKIITAEQPSPVSVLDASFYNEEPPSPVKKKSDITRDLDDTLYDSSEENSEDLPLLSNNAKANFSSRTQNLVQILHQIDSNDERFTNFRDYNDPDHKYISEILLASGLLSSPSSSYDFHSSSHPINPKLFLALEQIKTNKNCFNIEYNAKKIAGLSSPQKMQRKLIFDVVSDILAQKLILESSTPWCQSNQPISRKIRGKLLLDELCTEIDKLQPKNRNEKLINEDENMTSLVWEELMHYPSIYTNSYMEIPNVVLDVERLIFKDLITEVVRSELPNHAKHCRQQLFSK
ncbi:protein LONGIFOLIA 1 isoform X1 [Vigna radiata var. radiata]|uniref:Protein LONGIFOLIA 1 isoform X1 n=1 Tax=Vigna radiata var. radiata TaxID=3916 RepID=A0A1S3VDU3_VIGRR|nr:protein LONGIFOLIA 1 isoform X1 [Vigna radiata var. radiata]XP_014516307.1 protein LONGIFOLIA 1 isoform X1 [Vigna radiata var. radiata]